MSKKFMKLAAAAAALSILLCGCGKQAQEDKPDKDDVQGAPPSQVLTERRAADDVFSVNYDPDAGINPIKASSSTNMQFCSLMYDSVFTVDEHFKVSSEVVTGYTTSDYIWWVFNIDTSIPMTDGTTMTAQDVVYSIQRAQQSDYYSGRLSIIYGISAMSESSFAVTTKYADSQFPALLNIPIIKYGTVNDEVPTGSGAYMLGDEGDRLVLFEKNRHASEMPVSEIFLKSYMDTAEKISAFEESLLDIVTNDPTGMYNLGYGSSNETRYYDTSNMHYIGFNMTSPFFQSSLCRYAVNFAVDKDEVVEYMNGSAVAASLPVLPGHELYDSAYAEQYKCDLEKCSAIFTSANVKDHDDDGVLEFLVTGIVVEINIDFIVNNNSTAKVQAARKIAENLNSIGITTTLRELSWSDYVLALEKGDYDMYYGEVRLTADWDLSYLFEEYDTDVYKYDNQGNKWVDVKMNYARCRDTSYFDLYRAYLAAPDAERYDKFQEAVRYLIENGGIVPVCFEKRQVLTHRGVVTGIKATQYDLFNKFNEWTIELK